MSQRLSPPAGRLAAAGLVGLSLAACADRAVTGTTYPVTVPQRHPIVLTDAPRTLDIFTSAAAGLDSRQREDVRAFAAEYRRHGQGALTAQVPAGRAGSPPLRNALEDVRGSLVAGGVPGGHLSISTYQPADPTVVAPIRLTFTRLQAKVSTKCGQWPQDLGISDPGFNLRNEPYWNLGCATQTNVAAQVADPVDLVRGRTEVPGDAVRRSRDIDNLRQGKDPSTVYRQDDRGRIGDVGR